MKETGFPAYQHEVKAILEGRQTMFRRVIKPQPVFVNSGGRVWTYEWKGQYVSLRKGLPELCPYGQVGDRLWVRETWATEYNSDTIKPSLLPVTSKIYYYADECVRIPRGDILSPPDYEPFAKTVSPVIGWLGGVRPSIFLPRRFSRITPEITGVKAERIQDISGADCLAEGIEACKSHVYTQSYRDNDYLIGHFATLWDSINAKRGYGWDVNPWVWALTFNQVAPI